MPKRAASPTLVGRPSPYHTAVTLFSEGSSATSAEAEPVVRRSKRVKVEQISIVKVENEDEAEETRPKRKARAKASTVPKPSSSSVKIEDIETEEVKLLRSRVKDEQSSASSPRKPKAIRQSLDTPHPAPPNWRDVYDTIKAMRAKIVAPVDTMGCDQAQNKESEPQVRLHSFSGRSF